ncbi:MAG TPA: hypothetical protein VFX98_19155 [Longimicrobiaceae bacterium]|nr:hypothetical protein [Longimicrobiaceae bacterium]
MRVLPLAAAVALFAACARPAGGGSAFAARTQGVVDVELEGSAAYCTQGTGALYTLSDADDEGRIILGRFSQAAPVPGTTFPVLAPEEARGRGGNAVWGAPVVFTGPRAFRMASVDSGTVTINQVADGVQHGRFRIFVTYGRTDSAGAQAGESGAIEGSFAAPDLGPCPADS